jgi:hypothetical protein
LLTGTSADPVPSESPRYLADEILVPKGLPGICAASQWSGVFRFAAQNRAPTIGGPFATPPVHIHDFRLVHPGKMGQGARPPIVRSVRHHGRTHRIAFHVRPSLPKMMGADQTAEEAILPQMARASCAGVVILGVTSVDAAQEDGQGVVALRHGDQVDVVGHEAPSQQTHLRVGEVLAQESKIGEMILVGGKGAAAVHSPLGDMAGHTGKHTTIMSWHMLKKWLGGRNALRKLVQIRLSSFLCPRLGSDVLVRPTIQHKSLPQIQTQTGLRIIYARNRTTTLLSSAAQIAARPKARLNLL